MKLMKGILNNYLPSVSSLSSLDLHHYKLLPEGLVFTLTVATKTTRPDETVEAFFTRFPEDSKLCPVECLNTYLSSTSRLRNLSEAGKSNNLFVSYIKPRQPVTTASVARWIRSFLTEAGIDTSVFKTHSVRGAATSAAANAFVPVQEILKMADWSNVSTFQQFYYKPVFTSNFGRAVLSLKKNNKKTKQKTTKTKVICIEF